MIVFQTAYHLVLFRGMILIIQSKYPRQAYLQKFGSKIGHLQILYLSKIFQLSQFGKPL